MAKVISLSATEWQEDIASDLQQEAIEALERGNALFFPQLPFVLMEHEKRFLTPASVGKSKNVSYNIHNGELRGTSLEGQDAEQLKAMIHRFAVHSRDLMHHLLPSYRDALICGRTSYRPVEIKGRSTSWRKDDTRLHVDSFPSAPVQDKRILRVFSNIHPNGGVRTWRLGGDFEQVAKQFLPRIAPPIRGASHLLRWLHVTKSRRSDYDHYMLKLHDSMKADLDYQARGEQIAHDFPANTSWMVYTDQAPHAAMAGQYALEQTFYLPVSAMAEPSRSPLRILERMTQRTLT